ncbi:MAG TPA: DUF2062 domain-containing protein [Planctomycetota bacterium]|nr:DUF2062 domain-containing protein [Planctomycetota bacterium]
MLTLISFIRKLFKQLKSDLTPGQLAVGAFFGILAGLTPFGAHLLLILTVALLLNCSMAALLLLFGAMKPLGLALGGVSFRLGTSLLADESGAYAKLIGALSDAPVLAYLGFDRYVVAGGLAIALPLALAVSAVFGFVVSGYRKRLAPKLADANWFQNAMKNKLFRFFKWLIAGKDKEAVEPKKRFILLRPFRAYMIVFIPLLYIGLTVGAGLYAQMTINGLAAKGVSKALGVQCTFGKIDYSFFAQRLAFENFQLPDPSNTMEDMVRIGGFEADLGFGDLLRKRLHLEKLSLKDVAGNVARNADGKLNINEIPAARPTDPAAKGPWDEWMGWVTEKGKDADLSEYWKKYQEYRRKKAEKKAQEEADIKSGKAKPVKPKLDYDPDLRWERERRDPLVRADLVEIRNLAFRMTDRSGKGGGVPSITSLNASATQLSTMPGWNGQPVTMKGEGLLADGKSGRLSFTVNYLPAKSDVEFKLDGVPVTDFKGAYEKSLPVNVDAGVAGLVTKAGVNTGMIDGVVNLQIDKLKISPKPGETKILGLDAQTSGYAIQGINAYGEKLPVTVGATVTGPAEDPTINVKLAFLEIAKKGLQMLGKQELQKYIDQIGGEADALKKLGADKLNPIQGEASKSIDALKKGDTKAVQESATKIQQDVKSLPDAKKDVEKKKDELKGAFDLFKKKEEPKK